jgi:ornithine cyclodeaminase/alanine dehydrogenase-like protein (mu-crystallin family)
MPAAVAIVPRESSTVAANLCLNTTFKRATIGSGRTLTTKSITVSNAPIVVMTTPSSRHCEFEPIVVQAAWIGLWTVNIKLIGTDIDSDLPASKDGKEHTEQTQSSVQAHHNIDDPLETPLSQIFDEP